MTSTIINYIFNKFLVNFVEIDYTKTNASIFTGSIKLKHLKIKREIFKTFNIPYLELIHGYIGKMFIDLKMPLFYNNPIKVKISKIFLHVRIKDINNLNKEEELNNMLEYKKNILINTEQLFAEVKEMKRQNNEKGKSFKKTDENEPDIVKKIINNLLIDIKKIVLRFDDNLSYKGIPFSIGMILSHIIVRNTKSDFQLPANSEEIIPIKEKNYKLARVEELSIYMDLYRFEEELNFEKMISIHYNINPELRQYLKEEVNFYLYCKNELKNHSKNFESHQYLLYQLNLTAKLSLNNEPNTKDPFINMDIIVPKIDLNITFKQFRVFLKFIAYINLNSYYQTGISSQYFNEKMSIKEKKYYVEEYAIYLRDKYINKNNIELPVSLKNIENHLDYKEIRKMRFYAMKKCDIDNKLEEINEKIEEKNNLLQKNSEAMKHLLEEKEEILKKEHHFMQTIFTDKLFKFEFFEIDNNVTLIFTVKILNTTLTIYEHEKRKEEGKWGFEDKILVFSIYNLKIELEMKKVGMIFVFILENIIISHEKIKNQNYKKIIFGDSNSKGNIFNVFIEINPQLLKSDLNIKIYTEKNMFMILNTYTLQYIIAQSVDVFTTTISLEEYSSYAKDSVLKYIKKGYENQYLPSNFSHTNFLLNIFLKCPTIIIPIDIFDSDRTQCIYLYLGELKVKSILPPRVESNPHINYKKTKDENLIYDIYKISLKNTRMSTMDNCIESNNFSGNGTEILDKIDFNMECKIILESENPNFDNIIVNISVSKMFFQVNEFQILLIIEFLGNYFQNGYKVELHLEKLKNKEKEKNPKIENKKESEKIKKNEKNQINEIMEKKKEDLDLISYEEKKKKAAIFYDSFIKSFSSSNYHRISNNIKTIHENKKNVFVNIILKQVEFSLKKNYPGNIEEKYLVFQMTLFQVECDIAEDGSLVVIVLVKNIELFDYNKDEKRIDLINENYQCLIKSSPIKMSDKTGILAQDEDKNSSFINYQLLMKGNEINNIVQVNDLNIIVSLGSLVNIYQFAMYYTEIYLLEMNKAEIWKKKKIEKRASLNKEKLVKNKKIEKNADVFDKINHKYLMNLNQEDNINNIKLKIKNKSNESSNIDDFRKYLMTKYNKTLGFERKRQILTVLVKVNNTEIKMPIDPKKIEEPLYKMNFNLVYNQNTSYIYTDFFTLPAKRIIGVFHESLKSSMNTSVSNFDLDMVYAIPNQKNINFTSSLPEDRLITNFRMSCLIENYLMLKSEKNIMEIDVILEPLLFAFGMRQLRKTWNFYSEVMKYIQLLWEKYKPYAKPDEKKMTQKNLREKIIREQISKTAPEQNVKINNKTKILVNIENFNNLLITNIKSDRIGVIFFDNTQVGIKNILIDIRVKKLMCLYLQNSRITDKDNVSNTLYEILTGDELPMKNYTINNLSMYYYIFGSIQANYYNIMTNNFEPLIERFEASVEMMQVAPIFRAKTNIIINDIINYNLSVDSLISLKSFYLKFNEEENAWDIQELINPLRWRSTFHLADMQFKSMNEMTRVYDIVLEFANNSGIDLSIFFESNPTNLIKVNSKEIYSFTSDTLYKARGLNKKNLRIDRNNFGVYLYDSYPIKDISYKKTDNRQYKVNVEINNKIIPLYLSIKIEPSYLVNKVNFSSSVAFFNETNSKKIFILIQNTNLEKYFIVVFQDSKEYIPLTWLISQPPESSIFIKFGDNGEMFKICDHITQLFHEPSNLQENQANIEEDLKKKFNGNDNPKFNKIIEIEKYENKNMKNSMYIEVNHKDENYFINFDYFLYRSKNIKNEEIDTLKRKEVLKALNKQNNNNENNDLNNSEIMNNIDIDILIPEINYEYVITIRHSLTIVNKLPLTLFFSYNDKNITLNALEKKDLNDYSSDKMNNFISIKIEYFDKFYTSEKINLIDIETHQYIDLKNENDNTCLKCHMIKQPKEKSIQKPKNYFIETKGYSINTYELIFFFDYIINNRLTNSIWILPCKNIKKMKQDEIISKSQQIFPTSLGLFSFPDYEYTISIRDENSSWSDPFNINTIGIQSSIRLDNKFNQVRLKQLINEIVVILTSSDLYDFSIIIIFEPKYIIINNLGFDIVYNQKNCSPNIEFLLKQSEFHTIKYEKIDKHFRIGIYDRISNKTNFSGYFNLENNEDVDLKLKINPSSFHLPKDSKLFSYDGTNYYILIRVINHSYDNGINYILLCHPLFPYLEIVNNLRVPLKITEKSTGNHFIINNQSETNFPFVWENPANYKDELTFEIFDIKENFSFSVFNEGELKIKEQGISLYYSVRSKNKTETRRFKIERTKLFTNSELDHLYLISRRISSSSYNCFIKGFGISLINHERKEIFYISLYNIKAIYKTNIFKRKFGTTTIINYILLVDNFQIDYCLNDSLKILLNPYFQLIPSKEKEIKNLLEKRRTTFIPCISASVITKTSKDLTVKEEMTSYEEIALALQKFEIKLEKDMVFHLIALYNEFSKHLDFFTFTNNESRQEEDKEPLLDVELPIPIYKLMKENENSVRNLINDLMLSPIKIDLTVRLDSKTFDFNIPGALKRIIGSFMNLGRISNCPLRFSHQKLENVYMSWYDLSWKIINLHIKQGIIQIFSVLGSLDIIGNPVNLLHDIKEGVTDFAKEPVWITDESKGLSIGTGILKGVGGLISRVVGGAFNSVQKFSSTLLVSLQTVLDRKKRDIIETEQNEPENIFIGFAQGIIGIGSEIGKGFYNLFTDPCKRGKTEGCSGFFRGLFKGLFGLVISPGIGILRFVSSLSGGIKNSCYSIVGRKKLITERFRHPRTIIEGEEMIHPYHENKAEAKEMLYIFQKEYTDYILYAEDFICANSGLGKKFSTAILTKKAIYVIYNSEKLIFEESLKAIKSVELHFSENKFIICLRLKNGKARGFKIHKDYSKIPTELFDLLYTLIEKIRIASFFSRRVSGLDRGMFKEKQEDDQIDKSSYTKTITENTYNSLATLQSKIDNE